jgi:simple sugar transport system permease protein
LADAAHALTPTPTPNPSPQGGGELTELAAPLSVNSLESLRTAFAERLGRAAEYIAIPALALMAALVAFGIFVALFGKDPIDLYFYMYQGAFGTAFSWQNTLTRAAPLILTALCTALPAQLGLVIIGGEGALLMGALAATSAALMLPDAPPLVVQLAMALAAMAVGGA